MKLQIRNYVPEALFETGKQQTSVRIPYTAFAMVDLYGSHKILASGGDLFSVGDPILDYLTPTEWQFVLENRGTPSAVAFLCGERICFGFGGLGTVGFLPIAVWEEVPEAILSAWKRAVGSEILRSPGLRSVEPKPEPPASLCAAIAECYQQSKYLFHPAAGADLRNICVGAAVFTGCRAETVNLPRSPMNVLPSELLRWTAFLLCLFLTLRGSAPQGPSCRLLGESEEISLEMRHTTAADAPISSNRLLFLSHPAFETGFSLESAKKSYRLEVSLLRPTRKLSLRSHTRPYTFSLTLLY